MNGFFVASSTAPSTNEGSAESATGPVVDKSTFASRVLSAVHRHERRLWALAFLLLVLDIMLTLHGLERGLTEANPVARAAMDALGPAVAMVLMKGFALVVAGLGLLALPRRCWGIVPLGLSLPWGLAVFINTTLILAVG